MHFATLLILLALLQYLAFITRTGLARGKLGIQAPAMTGHEVWERILRVQQNTAEQLHVFVPAVVAFAHFLDPVWVLLPGVLYLIGRQHYSMTYIEDPTKRAPGMVMTFAANVILVLGGLAGVLIEMMAKM